MKEYKEFEFGWLIFLVVIPVQLLVTFLYVNDIGDRPIGTNGFIVLQVVLLSTYLLFYGMTTTLTSEKIVVSFGVGLITKKIQIERITTVAAVKNPWYYGWGIRFIPNGMLYNISGTNGVELEFKESNKVIRIGTKNPAKLKQEIEKRLA